MFLKIGFLEKKSVYSIDYCLDKWEKAVENLRGNFRKKLDDLLMNHGFFKVMFEE